MRAWMMEAFDGVANLRLSEATAPSPGPGEALLEMKFAALNPADAFLALGQYPARPRLPHVLGRDGVGRVVAAGPGVTSVTVGQLAVVLRCEAGVNAWGTLAERTVVPAASLAPAPDGWSEQEMAAAPLVFLTAWQALTQWSERHAPPPPGTVVLITGASGGVGTATTLLAKSMGLTVAALSRSAAKRARLAELGADLVFDSSQRDWRKPVLAALDPRKVDLVVDSVAGPDFAQAVAVLGHRGAISVVGRSAGVVPEFNTATLFFKRNRIGGVSMVDYTPAETQAIWKEIVARLDRSGRRPVIDRIFPFAEVKSAFARLAEGPMGKVLVKMDGRDDQPS
ncbi:MAG TPA: zinc-binding alcohol dehydrogenase family protein [Bryobacteraceae bacterium]|nr:zinc-binding alcohol dehydrogenase family protein [Bryobacteraceae bacterium]